MSSPQAVAIDAPMPRECVAGILECSFRAERWTRWNRFTQRHAAELLRDALTLPPEARAALVDSLIESLDPTVDEDAEEAWRHEIALRIQQIDGSVELVSWHAARDRLRHRLER